MDVTTEHVDEKIEVSPNLINDFEFKSYEYNCVL